MLKLNKADIGIIAISILFILANAYFVIGNELIFATIPFVLFIGILLIFAPIKLYIGLAFLVPLSVPLYRLVYGLDFDFWFPTEPIIFLFLVILMIKSLKDRFFERSLFNHPAFWAILFYIGWLAICIIPSELPLVAVKYLMAKIWFIGVFFYLGFVLFKAKPQLFKYFIFAFITGLFLVCSITLTKHFGRGIFDQKQAHGACQPFFIDHTSYGATIAFLLPMVIGFIFIVRKAAFKLMFIALSIFFLFALIFSYSRAAWMSIIIAGAIWFVWYLRIRFSVLLVSIVAVFVLFFTFQFEIKKWLSSNNTDSSGNLKEHLKSAINVSTDASNLERINRWHSAIRMFEDRPFFGWGPGSFMFCYAPYQRSYERTIISTDFGTGGNAHSEYLGLLSEAGILGALSYVIILIIALTRGFIISLKIENKETRILLISSILGLITYVVHGGLNNFLDTDKIAVPFWSFIAFIVSVDILNRESRNKGLEKL